MPQNLHLPQFSMAGPGGHQRRDQLSAELRHRSVVTDNQDYYLSVLLHNGITSRVYGSYFMSFFFSLSVQPQTMFPSVLASHTQLTYCSNFPGIKVGLYVFMVPAIVSADEM